MASTKPAFIFDPDESETQLWKWAHSQSSALMSATGYQTISNRLQFLIENGDVDIIFHCIFTRMYLTRNRGARPVPPQSSAGATKNMSSLTSVSPTRTRHACIAIVVRACATLSGKGEGRRRTHPVFGLQRHRHRRRPGNPPLAVLAPSHALDGGDASFQRHPCLVVTSPPEGGHCTVAFLNFSLPPSRKRPVPS